jgi:hypothetical protein
MDIRREDYRLVAGALATAVGQEADLQASDDNKLIAGGWFTRAGGVSANCIAAWDGSSWAPLRSGMNNVVHVLTVYKDKLIAGGKFTSAGGEVANHIAAWSLQ